ncbi:MAG: DUF2971 domain-containing protein [Pseudomonadota bacterium]
MNDESEGLELKRVLQLLFDNSKDLDKYNALLNIVNTMTNAFLSNKYLFSASNLRDDISQWRAYTTIGKGICFAFHDDFISDKTIKKHQCIYDLESKKQFIQSKTTFSNYKNLEFKSKRMKNGSLSGLVDSVSDSMEFFKHESFSSEKETRWIDDLCSKGNEEVYYRPHKLGLMPYRSVIIDTSNISEIIIGPQVPKQNISTLYRLLKYNEEDKIIVSSTVTLR